MSTALSMHSPHNHGAGAFATSLQLSPAFRSLHAAALRQRQVEFERLRELARSDEFSDDESDGDEEEVDDFNGHDDAEDDDGDSEDDDSEDSDVFADQTLPPSHDRERVSPRDAGSDSDIDSDETVLLPFIRPTMSGNNARCAPHETMSPKTDDWTIVDKSPTCEGMLFAKTKVSESWFSGP